MSFKDEWKRLIHPYEDDDDYMEGETSAPAETSEQKSATSRRRSAAPEPLNFSSSERISDNVQDNKVVAMVGTTKKTQTKVVLAKPEKFEDAAPIADNLRSKRTVVLNLESTEKETSRRLLDFLSGVAYAQEGKIKKVSAATYIITPYNVDLIGDLLDDMENSGMYF